MIPPSTLIHVLTRVKARIEKGWTQGTSARNAAGKSVRIREPDLCPVSWSLRGALREESTDDGDLSGVAIMQGMEAELNATILRLRYTTKGTRSDDHLSYMFYEDEHGRTQAEVIALVQNTIDYIKETTS